MVPGKPDVSPESLVECASPRLPSRRCHDHLLTCSAPDCDRTMPRGFAENAVTKQALRVQTRRVDHRSFEHNRWLFHAGRDTEIEQSFCPDHWPATDSV
jgi:hypothetical protein